jgi:hypothetical protein
MRRGPLSSGPGHCAAFGVRQYRGALVLPDDRETSYEEAESEAYPQRNSDGSRRTCAAA